MPLLMSGYEAPNVKIMFPYFLPHFKAFFMTDLGYFKAKLLFLIGGGGGGELRDRPGSNPKEMMQYFQNGYSQLIVVNPIMISFNVDRWWLMFTENEGQVLSTEILFKQEKLFWNKLLNCKYGISGIPQKTLV